MRNARDLLVNITVGAALLVCLAGLPLVVSNRYLIHILIATGMYIALALAYDLVVGQVGLISLAHPAFFGVGAYAAAILSTRLGTSYLLDLVLGGVIAATLALLVSKPFFRLAGVSFAIGTLGFSLIVQLVATNELWLTEGPMCVDGVPRPRLILSPLLDWQVSSVADYYYLTVALVLLVVALCSRLTTFRVGRTFMSVREDEILAMASGVDPLKHKIFAFVTGAFIAGVVGAHYVHYTTIICPTEMSNYLTTMMLIILFLGGVGRMRGVILGAIVFTFVPEFLRVAESLRMVIYGALLLVAIIYMPEGLDGVLTKFLRKLRRSRTRPRGGGNERA